MVTPRLFALPLVALFLTLFIGCAHYVQLTDERVVDENAFIVAVMDPMARDMPRSCVPSFAQRQYRALAPVLADVLERQVEIQFAPTLEDHIDMSPTGNVDLVSGKHSVVHSQADRLQVPLEFLGYLTDAEGKTTHHGIFVVPSDDEGPQTVADLQGYTIFFGSPDFAEKHSAAIATLTENGIEVPANPPTFEKALFAIEAIFEDDNTVAVLSSYEKTQLEDCGTIPKDIIRIVGTTGEVPFIAFFFAESVSHHDRAKIISALDTIRDNEELRRVLATKWGVQFFGSVSGTPAESVKKNGE
jgi:ABC-type phosphate/phosphonate transport system substrate-binding protein